MGPRAARAMAAAVRGTRAQAVLQFGPIGRLRDHLNRVHLTDLMAVLDRVQTAGIDVWISGGWGVDALLGTTTRPHFDIDLLVRDDGHSVQDVVALLSQDGYAVVEEAEVPTGVFRVRTLLRDEAGHLVDVHPATLPPDAATMGSIDGTPVPCISAAMQLAAHKGYSLPRRQRRDVARLRRLIG